MSDALKLALTITATDMAGGVLRSLRERIVGTGEAAKQAGKDFDDMLRHFQAGVKALAVSKYLADKIKPGVSAAADLQESLLTVKGLLYDSGDSAGALAAKMKTARDVAMDLSTKLAMNASDIADIEGELLQGGLSLESVKNGAAYSAAAIASYAKLDPGETAETLAKIGHAFQLNGEEYSDAANVMMQVSNAASTSIGELFHNMQRAGPAAHNLGMSMRETSALIAAVSPLGEEAGSDVYQFLNRLAGAGRGGNKAMAKLFFDDKGHFVGPAKTVAILREKFGNLSDEKRIQALSAMFHTQGGMVANLLIQKPKPGSMDYGEIYAASEKAASLKQLVDIQMEGLNKQIGLLKSTSTNLLANLFEPAIAPLTEVVKLMQKASDSTGRWLGDHQGVSAVLSGGAIATTVAGGLYAAYRIAQGGVAGSRLLRGLKGLGGVGVGVAEGKALEAATGVKPVFVTNWPAGGLPGGGPDVPGLPKGTLGKLGELIKSQMNLKNAGRLGKGLAIGAAWEAGQAVGSWINKNWVDGTKFGDVLGHGLAEIAAVLGSKEAQAATQTDVNLKLEVTTGQGMTVQVKEPPDANGKINTTTTMVPGI